MKGIILIFVSFFIGFFTSSKLLNSQEDSSLEKNVEIKIINENITKKEIEVIPSFIKEDIQKIGLNSSFITEKNWEEFLSKVQIQSYEEFIVYLHDSSLLHEAINKKDKDLFYLLLEKGHNINKKNSQSMTPLLYAIKKGMDLDFIKELIKKGADLEINKHDKRKPDALTHAIRVNKTDTQLVDYLLENGFEIEDKHIGSLIREVSAETKKYAFRYIDNLEINNEKHDFNTKRNIRSIISMAKDDEVISYLLDNKLDLNSYKDEELLVFAAMNKNISNKNFLKIVESKNTDINIGTWGKVTPLMTVLMKGDIEKTKILLEHGAKIELSTTWERDTYSYIENANIPLEKKDQLITLLNQFKDKK